MNNINLPKEQREAKHYPTCHDLAEQGRWDKALCCAECHGNPNFMLGDAVTAQNPFNGTRTFLLCCRPFVLLDDWYPGRHYHSLPDHE
jgi:hypothetical protein